MTVHWLLDIQLLISVAFGGRTCSLQSKISHLLLERGCRVGTSLFSSLPDTHQLPIVEGPLVFPQMPKTQASAAPVLENWPAVWRQQCRVWGQAAPTRWTQSPRFARALVGKKVFCGIFFFLW